MNRDEAVELVKANVRRRNVFRHMLAVEAIMRGVAEHLGEDVSLWSMTGLLHDIDYEKTKEDFERHGVLAQDILKGKVPEEVLRAIEAHNCEHTGVIPKTKLEKALIASDAISGLIVACALVMPSKKAKDVTVKTIKKKFKDKDFARGVDRKRIDMCKELGVQKEDFYEISLEGIQSIGQDLGL